MKLRTLLVSSLLITTFSANAFDFLDSIKEAFGFGDDKETQQESVNTESTEQVATSLKAKAEEQAPSSENALLGYASEQLGLSPDMTSGALGAVFKVAKDNLGDDFASISDAIPGVDNYIKDAPSVSMASLGGLASSLGGSGEKSQALASLGYLDAAFKKIGIPKETVLPLVNTVTGYLETNGYGSAASMLKQGMNFL